MRRIHLRMRRKKVKVKVKARRRKKGRKRRVEILGLKMMRIESNDQSLTNDQYEDWLKLTI